MLKGFRARLRSRERLLGPMIQIASPAVVEIAATAGADYVVLDTEHGEFDLGELPVLIRAADAANVASIVKLRALDESAIGKALDLGANGVVLPDISDEREARRCVRAAKYRPAGERGGAPMVRAASYSAVPWQEYAASANEETTVWVKVEGENAMRSAAAIAAVPGIDVVSIGPFDLSQALGIPGDLGNPRLIDAVRRIAEAVAESGGVVGSFAPDAATVERWSALGLTVFNLSADISILIAAMRALYAAARPDPHAPAGKTIRDR